MLMQPAHVSNTLINQVFSENWYLQQQLKEELSDTRNACCTMTAKAYL